MNLAQKDYYPDLSVGFMYQQRPMMPHVRDDVHHFFSLFALVENRNVYASVFAERTTGGYFLDFDLKRDQLARYGLTVDDANDVLMSAVGGEPVTTTIEGRERYSVNVRYLRDYRSDIEALRRVLVSTPSGAQIPLAQIASVALSQE